MAKMLTEYLRFLTGAFFRWWWAAITGLASILGLVFTPETGVTLGPATVLIAIFLFFSAAFLTLAVLVRGWDLYARGVPEAYVHKLQRLKDGPGEWMFILRGKLEAEAGDMIDIHRRMGDSEVPFALLEIERRTSAGDYQARPVAMAPAHTRDFTRGQFTERDLVASFRIKGDRLRGSLDDIAAARAV